MAVALSSATKLLVTFPPLHSLSQKPIYSLRRLPSYPTITTQSSKPNTFLGLSLKTHGFLLNKKMGFVCKSENGEGGERKKEVDESRGESTMPERFRYLTKEAPDRPVRWPWLVALAFGIYAWRTVLWELSNWKKAALAIAGFMGYLSKFVLAFVFYFIGTPVTSLIRFVETVFYSIRGIYSDIVAAAPVQELTVIIVFVSILIAIAEAAVPDSANSQPYMLTLAGIIGFAAVMDYIPELVFWLLLMGLFSFSWFFKKKDVVTSTLPVAAALSAVGQPWLRVVVMTSYVALAISYHSKKLSEGKSEVEATVTVRKLPAPLLVAALAIGIHVAAKWIRYRHLTWMIV
ncbi:hypothetical protein IFM89_008096 [Coptis chinensis]|uniref:Uncharacterized protein n=1 Tax=Coptis chinensis TaxID=261450 RepID=A0A835M930_9MAGN|nr:hypothetical protein IFM89_008096 [Coptis chinensis]